jgi:ADP-ribosylglycohydrolase
MLITSTRAAERYSNSLIGLAAGDAWGYQVEFVKYDRMPSYPVAPPAQIWRVSDDTQMTLALHDALTDAGDKLGDVTAVTAAITARFLQWQTDPDNNRAPGATCMESLRRLRGGARWHDTEGAVESAGCGAVMRLAPAAFCPDEVWLGITALQALITHKHPRAIAAALILGEAIRMAPSLSGRFLEHSVSAAMSVLTGESPWLHDEYLATALSPITTDVQSYLAAGFDDGNLDALLDAYAVKRELDELDPALWGDPCVGIGEGWESATAVAVGLLVADMGTPRWTAPAALTGAEALGWAATSNGDSDSIACIAGAVIGAAHDDPEFWITAKVLPRFEDRYSLALRKAPTESTAFRHMLTGAVAD